MGPGGGYLGKVPQSRSFQRLGGRGTATPEGGEGKSFWQTPAELFRPAFFLQQKAKGSLRPEDPEQYQQKALSQWFPVGAAEEESDAYRAVQGLAEVVAEPQDFLCEDFLAVLKPVLIGAVRALSLAIQANDEG